MLLDPSRLGCDRSRLLAADSAAIRSFVNSASSAPSAVTGRHLGGRWDRSAGTVHPYPITVFAFNSGSKRQQKRSAIARFGIHTMCISAVAIRGPLLLM